MILHYIFKHLTMLGKNTPTITVVDYPYPRRRVRRVFEDLKRFLTTSRCYLCLPCDITIVLYVSDVS